MRTETSAGVILYKLEAENLLVLLLHYAAGHWDFPKGKLEQGETELQAALRELEEETGVTQVDIEPNWKQSMHYFYTRDGKRISKTVVFFLGRAQSSKVKLSDEHQAFDWLTPTAAEAKLTFENAKQLLRLATPVWKK